MTHPAPSLEATWGLSTDGSPRFGRLAAIENDAMQAIDGLTDILGGTVAGAFPDVAARLASMTAGSTGYAEPVRAATVLGATYTFATSFDNGSVLDGVTLVTGNEILIATGDTNAGVYTVQASGAPVRRPDFASGADYPGRQVFVAEGTTNARRTFVCTNTTTPTIGVTAIQFTPSTYRPASYTIAASNSPMGNAGADYVCDGTADEFEINLLLFLLSLAPLAGKAAVAEIRLGPGTFTFSSPVIYGLTNSGDGISIRGSGHAATTINRSTDCIAFDMSGTGTYVHASATGLSDMQIIGSVAPHTQPAVRLYYASHVAIERVDFTMTSVGIQGLEWWDSLVAFCDFDQCGTAGLGPRAGFTGGGAGSSGGNPAILLLGDIALSGFGHTTDNCNALRFRDCTWESQTDGCIQAHGNYASDDFAGQLQSVHNTMWFDGCKFESGSGYGGFAPYLNFLKCNVLAFRDGYHIMGAGFAGATAQNIYNFDSCSGVRLSTQHFGIVSGSTPTRTFVRFSNCNSVSWDLFTLEMTSSPSVAAVEFSGTNSNVIRGRFQVWFGTTVYLSGSPTTEYEPFGTATIAIGATTTVVTHRLPRTPVAGELEVFLFNKPTTDIGQIGLNNIGASTFQINCFAAPVGTAAIFGWRAKLLDV